MGFWGSLDNVPVNCDVRVYKVVRYVLVSYCSDVHGDAPSEGNYPEWLLPEIHWNVGMLSALHNCHVAKEYKQRF